jgi:hypothetical protein
MRFRGLLAVAGAFAVAASPAAAATMHPTLGARLSGMGEHGVVNLQVKAHDLCWTFALGTKGLTGASIRDKAGMVVAKLGSTYRAKGCAMVSTKALHTIDARPGAYRVWVDTKGHPGELRGTLFAGMAHR